MIWRKIRVLIDYYFLFARDYSTKIYNTLSFIISLCTTIQGKIRVLINMFILFVYDHLAKN